MKVYYYNPSLKVNVNLRYWVSGSFHSYFFFNIFYTKVLSGDSVPWLRLNFRPSFCGVRKRSHGTEYQSKFATRRN